MSERANVGVDVVVYIVINANCARITPAFRVFQKRQSH